MYLRDKNIFIVEDNLMNRVTYQVMLVSNGARVEFERWGAGTVPTLQRIKNFDLIILDLMLLQGANGYDLFREIRQIPHYQHTPIVAVSAAEPSEAMARCRELGFSGYIAKPIDEQLFPKQLARLIEGEQVWVWQ